MMISSHIQRWITGLLVLPVLILWLGWGGQPMFALLIALVCLVTQWEYFRMTLTGAGANSRLPLMTLGYATGLLVIWAAYLNTPMMIIILISLNFLTAGAISLSFYRSDPGILQAVSMQIQGTVYIPVMISSLIFLRNTGGISWIFFLLAIVFAGDIGAYYAGSYMGHRKLCPAVSPNKTVEGSAGGLMGNLLVGGIIKAFFFPSFPWKICIPMFLCIGFAGQMGDLFESALKRSVQIKDSGSILPGHGGMLDRIDALIFASPVALVFKDYFLN